MRKHFFLVAVIGLLLCGTQVFAFTSVAQITSSSPTVILPPSPEFPGLSSYSFTLLFNNPHQTLSTATLDLSGYASTAFSPSVVIQSYIVGGGTYFLYQSHSFSFDSQGNASLVLDIDNINRYISSNNSSNLYLVLTATATTMGLNGARLTGTVAPEPASMALICAGLVALPAARRLRKSFITS